jgi:hypothetical protein
MRKRRLWIGIAVGIALSGSGYAALSGFQSAELLLGDHTFPKLHAWQFKDHTHDTRLFVSNTAGSDGMDSPSLFYSLVPPGVSGPHITFSTAIRTEGKGDAVAGVFYAETESKAAAYGANPHAASYAGGPAVGMEVNGLNFSGDAAANVRGMDIVNGGNAGTQWALGIETSIAQPKGIPSIGIALAGEAAGFPVAPARDTGLFIDRIESGEAIRIQAGDRVALNNEGTVYFLYNPGTNQIEFYNAGILKFAIPM